MKQSILIFFAIILGILLPQGHQYTYLIKYTLMVMLFFAFLGIDIKWNILRAGHVYIALLNILLPLGFYFILKPINIDVAIATFAISIAPTAAAAPVIAQFLRTQISFLTASVLITSPVIAIILPIILPTIGAVPDGIKTYHILLPILSVIGIPLFVSILVKTVSTKAVHFLRKFSMVSFLLFIFNVWLGCGKATHYISVQKEGSVLTLLWIGLAVMAVCIIQFEMGKKLETGNYKLAASLALGRKNTMFALWISLTFLGPLVAMGPIFYILYQNLYNSWQIFHIEKTQKMSIS